MVIAIKQSAAAGFLFNETVLWAFVDSFLPSRTTDQSDGVSKLHKLKEVGWQSTNDTHATHGHECESPFTCIDVSDGGVLFAFCSDSLDFN